MAQMQSQKLLVSRAVYDAMEKQHPIEHSRLIAWIQEGKAEIVEES
jgi:hypothetical protein